MIRLHEFNTRWWGAAAGVLDDDAFFALPRNEREQALAPYEWVEFRSGFTGALPLSSIASSGFYLADIQINFRIALKQTPGSFCEEESTVCFAGEPGFAYCAEDLAPFEHERFVHLPGHSPARLNARYAEWAGQLIHDYPETSLAVLSGGAVQGWFLSRPTATGLNLALAVAHRNAGVSGFLLYQKSLSAYAAKGYRIGSASFSATNTAVHNIYAKLGARFTAPTGIWFWTAGGQGL